MNFEPSRQIIKQKEKKKKERKKACSIWLSPLVTLDRHAPCNLLETMQFVSQNTQANGSPNSTDSKEEINWKFLSHFFNLNVELALL